LSRHSPSRSHRTADEDDAYDRLLTHRELVAAGVKIAFASFGHNSSRAASARIAANAVA